MIITNHTVTVKIKSNPVLTEADVEATMDVSQTSYVESFTVTINRHEVTIPTHNLDEIVGLYNALKELIEEARGIDNGSLFD